MAEQAEEYTLIPYTNYNEDLKIQSVDDLMTTVVTQLGQKEPQYRPCDKAMFEDFERTILHLKKEVEYAIDEIERMLTQGHVAMSSFALLNNLEQNFSYTIRQIRKIHKSIYVSLYYNWQDEIVDFYEKQLKPVFNKLSKYLDQHYYVILDYAGFDVATSEMICKMLNDEKNCYIEEHIVNSIFRELASWSRVSVKSFLKSVETAIYEIRQVNFYRTTEELSIIYNYIKDEYKLKKWPQISYHFAAQRNNYFERNLMRVDSTSLRELQNIVLSDGRKDKMFRIWDEYFSEEDTYLKMLVAANATNEDFDSLFMRIGQYEMVHEELQKRIEYESNGDPMFCVWVDADKLQEHLKFWVKGYIKEFQHWSLLWSLMKYTVKIIKDNVALPDFSNRMNEMFPDAEKPCKYQSYRGHVSKYNRQKSFDTWSTEDPLYELAKSLNEKLRNKEKYKRDNDMMFQ